MNQFDKNVILTIIAKHNNLDPSLSGKDIELGDMMYAYGSTDEFEAMLDEIEETFGVILTSPSKRDIGPMTVQEFINSIMKTIDVEKPGTTSRIRGWEIKLEGAILPRRQTLRSAAYDIHACISEPITIQPNEMEAIETGIAAYMLEDEFVDLRIRSGGSAHHQLTLQNDAGVIDQDFYPKTIKVLIRNEGKKPYTVQPGERIAQALFLKRLLADNDEPVERERDGGFGHTEK
jgi:dUTP pyrophosphatase